MRAIKTMKMMRRTERRTLTSTRTGWYAAIAIAIAALPAWGQSTSPVDVELPALTIVGSRDAAVLLPGAAHYLAIDDFDALGYGDIHRLLKAVPGVYVREEDGFGLFPNISIRGTSIGRSEKVTLMEDGVLTAPAPYAAPSAYYSPTAGRMHAVEALKGSSQVQHGPHTTGGVLNYLSTPVPDARTTYLKLHYGTDADRRLHLTHGDRGDTLAYLVEIFGQGNDGFKTIDPTAATAASDDTGFEKLDGMLKLDWRVGDNQRVELKVGRTDTDADETYVGLSDADFDLNPYRRYAASRFDSFESEHERAYLRHYWAASDDLTLTTTLYYHDFHRNWYKLNDINLADGSKVKTGAALASASGLAVLKGQAAGTLNVKANNRDYSAKGLESLVAWSVNGEQAMHEFQAGIRVHSDQMEKFQHADSFSQDASGAIVATKPGAPGSSDDKLERATAVAVHLQDRVTRGQVSIIPGIRVEHVDYKLRDWNKGKRADNDLTAVAPGVGVNYAAGDTLNIFAGVYRGISTPGVGGATRSSDPLKEETSVGVELGLHYRGEALHAEAVAFYTDFDDLIVPDNVGGGGSGDDENAGDIVSYGLEWKATYDLGAARGWGISNPWFTTVTYTSAELDGDAASTSGESIFHGGRDGNEAPYIPEVQFTVGAALERDTWRIEVSGNYVDAVWSTAGNTVDPSDAKVGRIESHFVLDLAASIAVGNRAKISGSIHNLADEAYMVSRHPEGPRPGKPLTATLAYERTF